MAAFQEQKVQPTGSGTVCAGLRRVSIGQLIVVVLKDSSNASNHQAHLFVPFACPLYELSPSQAAGHTYGPLQRAYYTLLDPHLAQALQAK